MRSSVLGLIVVFLLAGAFGIWILTRQRAVTGTQAFVSNQQSAADQPSSTPSPISVGASDIVYPISDLSSRITKKAFGDYVTPTTSPVQPERFTGYHTGVDCETTAAEADRDVPIFAIADGMIVYRSWVSGYGGVVMIRSTVDGETVTALYGHIRLSSVEKAIGDTVSVGERIAVLGTGGTPETDGERKHLHFSLLRGDSTDLRGYVQDEAALTAWIDPVAWFRERLPSP